MAELADAPDLGSGVLRRAGSSPVIRTFHKGIWPIPFFILPIKLTLDSVTLIWIIRILSIFWFDFYLRSLKSSIFGDFVDSSNTYSSVDHPQLVNFIGPYSTYFPASHQQHKISLTPPVLTFQQVTNSTKFHWLLQHLLSDKSPTAQNFIDPYSTYFPASHQQPKISLTPTALTFRQVTNSPKFRWPLQHLFFSKSSPRKIFPAT